MLNCWSKALLSGSQKVKFTIIAVPTTSIVTINGQQQTEIIVPAGTTVEWSVAADGYITQSGCEILNESLEKNITLKSTTTKISPTNRQHLCQYITDSTYFKNYGVKYTFKYSFKAGHTYTIQYTTAQQVHLVYVVTSSSSSQQENGTAGLVDEIYSNNYGTTVNAGTYTHTKTMSKDAAYLMVQLEIIAGSSYPSLKNSIIITDNS